MKKSLRVLILLSLIGALLFPIATLAQRPDNGNSKLPWPPPPNAICCKLKTAPLGLIIIVGQEGWKQCYFPDAPIPDKTLYIVFPKPEAAWKMSCRIDGDPIYGWGIVVSGGLEGCVLHRDILGYHEGEFVRYEDCPQCCVLNAIYNITDLVFKIALALAVLLILIGAVLFMTSSGDPNRVGLAKNMILYTIIGVGVILLARIIIAVVIRIIAG